MATISSRRHQRLRSFEDALDRLADACERTSNDHLERAGLIKTFEFCFELSWKVLQDLLSHEGYDSKIPRAVVRTSFSAGIPSEHECKLMLRALDSCNLLSHAYSAPVALQAEELIKELLYPALLPIYTGLREGPTHE